LCGNPHSFLPDIPAIRTVCRLPIRASVLALK